MLVEDHRILKITFIVRRLDHNLKMFFPLNMTTIERSLRNSQCILMKKEKYAINKDNNNFLYRLHFHLGKVRYFNIILYLMTCSIRSIQMRLKSENCFCRVVFN